MALSLTWFVAGVALAQDPNACDEVGEAPDVIVGDLHELQRYGTVGDITAYSVGTVSCNIGTCWLNWISSTNQHPVIGQNMYRLKDGRMEQIGQGWLKHGFFALSEGLCSGGCISTNGSHLGVNCSDPYSSGLNGSQSGLGPKSQVNASTGEFPYPFATQGQTGNAIYKRLQVHNDDLDPALNPGAIYVVEGQYVTNDDAIAGNNKNNSSWRQVEVTDNAGVYNLSFVGSTHRQAAAVEAWAFFDSGVKNATADVPNDGRFIVAGKVVGLGGGQYRYLYSVYNMTSDRSARAFRVPIPAGAAVNNITFHDVDYHSGEPYDGTDWLGYQDPVTNNLVWETVDTYDQNPDANALRWGTTYSFSFESDASPSFANTTIDLFKPGQPGDPDMVQGPTWVPNICNNDGVCDAGETCTNCPNDCINSGPSQGFCGDNVCEPGLGEDCLSCAADCNGQQSGNPGNRYCCGDGDGTNPVGCNDSRCTASGNTCGTNAEQVCCGDGTCSLGEDSCICAADCGPPPATESVCGDSIDEDCDGLTDCADLDCCVDAQCADGIDADGDGVAECDCDDGNSLVWSTPTEVLGLTLNQAGGATELTWDPPLVPGAVTWHYDVLRSPVADNFGPQAVCVLIPDPTQEMGADAQDPASGVVFKYLVRAVNDCPQGAGPLGQDTTPKERDGRTCP